MKIPKTLKLPRKLKKEFKKGIEKRIYKNSRIYGSSISTTKIIFEGPGSKTKYGRKLAFYMIKEEKRKLNTIIDDQVLRLRLEWDRDEKVK